MSSYIFLYISWSVSFFLKYACCIYYLSLMWCDVSLCSVWCMYVSCLFLYPPLMKHGLLEDTLFSSVIFLFESPMKLVDFPSCHVWWNLRVNSMKSHSKSHKATIFLWFFYAFPRIFVIFPRSQGPWSTSDLTMIPCQGCRRWPWHKGMRRQSSMWNWTTFGSPRIPYQLC